MTKKLLIFSVALMMSLSFLSCGKDKKTSPPASKDKSTSSTPAKEKSTPSESAKKDTPPSVSIKKGKYTGGPVKNGGSITGVVKASQKKDGVKRIEGKKLKQEIDLCGSSIPEEKYVIKNGNVKWAVAMLESITKGKPLDETKLTINNKLCRFEPHVMVVSKGGNIAIKNSDPILHNTHLYILAGGDKRRTIMNLALPRKDQVIPPKKKFTRKVGLLEVLCDAHDFMQGYIWVLPHPYGAVTNDAGQFKLTDVPPGKYKLKIWHEALGEKTIDVTVEAGKEAKVTVKL